MNHLHIFMMNLFILCIYLQGILMEHQEKEFGDKTDLRSVLQAVKKMQKSN